MKRQYATYIDDEVRKCFEDFCADSMEPSRYMAAWITELSKVKPEFALKVLGLIPPEWKHRGPGRPPSIQAEKSKGRTSKIREVA